MRAQTIPIIIPYKWKSHSSPPKERKGHDFPLGPVILNMWKSMWNNDCHTQQSLYSGAGANAQLIRVISGRWRLIYRESATRRGLDGQIDE